MRLIASSGRDGRGGGDGPSSTARRIVEGALQEIVSRGVGQVSMSDVIDASGVSRGTLYRYFPSKEAVLTAVSEFVCQSFEDGIRSAGQAIDDPLERFRAVMRFYSRFTRERAPDQVFEIEPRFHLDFFRSHFDRHKRAVRDALDFIFDLLDAGVDGHFDRDSAVETLVRAQLSTLIIPADDAWLAMWCCIPDTLDELLGMLHRCTETSPLRLPPPDR